MNTVRRISSGMLGVGESKIRFKPDAVSKIAEALTREDVRSLIKDGSITAIERRGVSRIRGRARQVQKGKRRRTGHGSRRGTVSARKSGKETWMEKVRAQRRFLRESIANGSITKKDARRMYLMVKGNAFKGVKLLQLHAKDSNMIDESKAQGKKPASKPK